MKKDNRGFTLVEIIIAMSIFIVVIGLAYKILSSTNISLNKNSQIYENQLSFNNVNKFVTKDLELNKNIYIEEKVTSEDGYYYILESDSFDTDNINYIVYDVLISPKNNDFNTYTIVRKSYELDPSNSGSNPINEIDIISNQLVSKVNIKPFIISTKDDSDKNVIYQVDLDYADDKKEKIYSFNVSSRFVDVVINTTKPEEVPQPPNIKPEPPSIDGSEGLGYMGFWVADPSKKQENNLYVWANSTVIEGETYGKFGTQSNIQNGVNISGNGNIATGTGHNDLTIGNNTNVTTSNKDHFPNLKKVQFSLLVSEGVQFLNENGIIGFANGVVCNHPKINIGEHYHSEMYTQNSINLSGKIKLLEGYDSGYVLVVYGK